jgi:uncharacterized iron-regulated membrane protein
MNKNQLKQLVKAHNQLGLWLSPILFVIFFSGSISLFKSELNTWQWRGDAQDSQSQLSAAQMIEAIDRQLPLAQGSRVTLLYPDEHKGYYQVDVRDSDGKDERSFFIDPVTAKVLGGDPNQSQNQSFGNFIYDLHTVLRLPGGRYITGVIALYLLFILLSGLVIHWEKLSEHLFKFRPDSASRWLDLHKLIGVTSLPFSLLMAFTGVIFNLLLIYQIAFVVVVYKGDQSQLLSDAGFFAHQIKADGEVYKVDKKAISELQRKVESQAVQSRVVSMRIEHYGDKQALVNFTLKGQGFEPREEVVYRLYDKKQLFKNTNNTFKSGLSVLKQLHVGDYGGDLLKWLYFCLAQGCCVLLLTGNILWLKKQAVKPSYGAKTLALHKATIYALIPGFMLATLVGFIFVKLPLAATVVGHWQGTMFLSVMMLVPVVAFALGWRDKGTAKV